jgi:hypothetical protein
MENAHVFLANVAESSKRIVPARLQPDLHVRALARLVPQLPLERPDLRALALYSRPAALSWRAMRS